MNSFSSDCSSYSSSPFLSSVSTIFQDVLCRVALQALGGKNSAVGILFLSCNELHLILDLFPVYFCVLLTVFLQPV